MSIEARLYTALTTYAGLTALIGTRAYPLELPQNPTLPAVTYLLVSVQPVVTRADAAPPYTQARYQLDGWAANFDAAVALRKQIRAAMGAWRVATAGQRVDVALLVGDRDSIEVTPQRWLCTLDYMVHFQED